MHHDLKPENLLIDDDFRVTLIDFGLATHLPVGEKLHYRMGSPGYVAPEMLGSKGYDLRGDVYSAGAIIYFLLCGQQLFRGKNLKEILKKNMEGKIPLSGGRWDEVSSAAKNFISRVLSRDPANRLTSTEALQHKWLCNNKIAPFVRKLYLLSSDLP